MSAAGSVRKRVLVVDDDESIVEALRYALSQRGFEVLVARDGAEGIARIERDAPDLVVLDLVMPRRNGLAVLDRLIGARRRPPIIVVSGNDEPRLRQFVADRGATAFVAKPFDVERLAEQIEAVLGGR